MAQPVTIESPRARRIDPFAVAAGVFLLAALAFGAYPAFRAGPSSLGGVLLLTGLAGVAFFAILALRSQRAGPAEGLEVLQLIDALVDPLAIATADGRILAANDAWEGAAGASGRLPKSIEDGGLFAALGAARRGEIGEAALKLKGGGRLARITMLDQRRYLVALSLERPAEPAKPAPVFGQRPATGLDVFAASAPFGAALFDGPDVATATIVRANAALEAMTGEPQLTGARLAELIEPQSWAEAMRAGAKEGPGPFEVRFRHDPNAFAQLQLSRGPEGLVAYLVDVSERKQMELQLAQSEKMRAIGQFVGGVAHDFNNLLTGLTLKLGELFQRHPVGDPSYQDLSEIRSTVERATDLVSKLLAYSRQQTVQREVLELGGLVSEIEVLLRRLLREDVTLETDYGRNPPLVRGDKSHLETAVINLAVNARDALRAEGKRGGVVRIKTARLTLGEARALGYADERAGEGDLALIEVADNGPGIPPDVQSKIFDPFFTTKPVGEGTGLGLSTVYGIVKQAGGWIALDSAPGQGATFRIFLPVHTPAPEAVVAAPPKPAAPPRPAARDLSGNGRILFVEDEHVVRATAAKLLRQRGYEVLEAGDGDTALRLAEENAGTIDLLISDVIMPGSLDGPKLWQEAKPFLGAVPVMFISGYAEAEFSNILEDEPGVSFLAKPFDIKTLAERVKQQLQPG